MRLACFVVLAMCCGLPLASCAQEGAMRSMKMPEYPAMLPFAADGEVHVLPSTMPENSTSADSRPDRWVMRGFALKGLLARLYRTEETRVEIGDAAMAARRFDVSVAAPGEERQEAIEERVKEALQRTLHIAIVPESRTMEAYVVSSPQGPGPGMRAISGGGGIGGGGMSVSTMRPASGAAAERGAQQWIAGRVTGGAVTSGSLSVGGPIRFFCKQLERVMDRPVMDETALTGAYEIRLRWERLDEEGFLKRLHEELGLLVTPGTRAVPLLVVREE